MKRKRQLREFRDQFREGLIGSRNIRAPVRLVDERSAYQEVTDARRMA